jgi:large subunit ribosomal protein L15
MLGFEGGQMPLHRRLPKRGFTNIFKKEYAVVNLSDLERFDNGATVDEAALRQAGLVKGRHDGVKVLGNGKLSKKLTVSARKFSESARKGIEAAGGTCQEIQ